MTSHPTEVKLPESLEVMPELDAAHILPYSAIRYVNGYPESYVKAYARSFAESALKARDAEIERLRGDAERYRWLRDEAHPDRDDTGISVSEADFNDWGNRFTRYFSGNALDAAIDQARATGGEKANG